MRHLAEVGREIWRRIQLEFRVEARRPAIDTPRPFDIPPSQPSVLPISAFDDRGLTSRIPLVIS